MSTTITADNGAEIEVCRLGISVVHPERIAKIWARLSADQRHRLAEALSPAAAPTGGQWTRDDLPRIGTPNPAHDPVVEGALDTVVRWLNKHYPKPDDQRAEYAEERAADLTRERDAAVARAEQAEREASTWRTSTESAHSDFLQATNDRDEWKARAENLEREFAEFKGNANRLNVPAVDRDVVEAELVEGLYRGFTANQLMQRVCAAIDDDPAALIITEKSLPTVNHPSRWRNFDLADGTWRFRDATDEEIREALETVESDLRYLLVVSRAIEAEQAVDPVDARARELLDMAYPGEYALESAMDTCRRIAESEARKAAR